MTPQGRRLLGIALGNITAATVVGLINVSLSLYRSSGPDGVGACNRPLESAWGLFGVVA